MTNQEYVTRTAKIWLDDEGIVRKIFLEGAQETLKDALESGDVIVSLCENRKRPLLVDFSPIRSMDAEARAYYSGQEVGPAISAVAGVTKSRFAKVLGNFFMGFNKPPTPGRLFNTQEEALAWLKTFL